MTELNSLRKEISALRRYCSSSRSRNFFRKSRPSLDICWYHRTFKDKATNCKQPFSYKENTDRQVWKEHMPCHATHVAYLYAIENIILTLIDTGIDSSLLPAVKKSVVYSLAKFSLLQMELLFRYLVENFVI